MSDAASDNRREMLEDGARIEFITSLMKYLQNPRKRGLKQRVIDCAQHHTELCRRRGRTGVYTDSVEPMLKKLRRRDAKETARLLIYLLDNNAHEWLRAAKSIASDEVLKVVDSVDQDMRYDYVAAVTIDRLKKAFAL